MTDSNVSDVNNYSYNPGMNSNQQQFNQNPFYNYGNGIVSQENQSYNYKNDNSNNFVGGYQQPNGYSVALDHSGQNLNNTESANYVGYPVPTDPSAYQNSLQFQNYYAQTANYSSNLQENFSNANYYPTYTDSQANGNLQVNSNNYYSQSDQNAYSSQNNVDSLSSLKQDNQEQHHDPVDPDNSRDEEGYSRRNSEDPRLRSESRDSHRRKRSLSRDSYRRYRRRRSRSRSRGRRSRRRSHSHSHRRKRSVSYRSRSHRRSRHHRRRHRRHRSESRDSYGRHRSRSRESHRRHRSHSRSSYSSHREREEDRRKSHSSAPQEPQSKDLGMDLLEKAKMHRTNEIEKRRMKDIEEAQRDDLTVLVANMNLSVDEKDIYELFSEYAGKVRDIQCVRDLRSGRSKGIAYVEFYTQEAVIKALSMTGMSLKGQGIRVQSSQAEKNRAAKAEKQLQNNALKESDNPTTIVVSNLLGNLSHMNETDLSQLFSPFGNITDVALARTDNGDSKGYAYIRFKRWNEAKEALNVMNGFDISGQQIKVAYASTKKDSKSRLNYLGDLDMERLDDDDAGLISGSNVKIALMKKLQERQPLNSSNLVLSNMYTSSDYVNNREFFDEIEEDVREECGKYGTVAQVFVNRRNPDGKVYVKFRNNNDSQAANKSLQGRYFAGNTIQVSYISDDQFQDVVNKS